MKKVFSGWLTSIAMLAIFFVAFSIDVNAASQTEVERYENNGVTYVLYDTDGDTVGDYLEISGTGTATNEYVYGMSSVTADFTNPETNIKRAKVNSGITEVEYTFLYLSKLERVELPSGLVTIGYNTFAQCKSLKTLNIPSTVKEIGSYFVEGCDSLEQITLPASVDKIEYNHFWGKKVVYQGEECELLSRVRADDYTINTLTQKLVATEGYSHVVDVNGVVVTEDDGNSTSVKYVCSKCNKAAIVRFFRNVTNGVAICSKVMSSSIGHIDEFIPSKIANKNVVAIEWEAFNNSNLTGRVIIGDNIKEISSRAFLNSKLIESVVLPNATTFIPSEVFMGCTSLQSVDFPDKLREINYGAFHGCTSLDNVDLINTKLTRIDSEAFAGCTGLNRIVLPDTLAQIEGDAFSGCSTNLTIVGYENSLAQVYAEQHNIRFEKISGEPSFSGSDITAPVVTKIEVLSKNITRPGVIKLRVWFYEEETGVESINVSLKHEESGREAYAYLNLDGVYSGYRDIEVTLDSTAALGEWTINYVWVTDAVRNQSSGLGVNPDISFTVGEEFDTAFELSLSQPRLVSRLESMSEGKAARLKIDSNGILVKEAFDAIKGKDKTIVAYNDQMQWIFNGLEITNETKDVDLRANMYNDYIYDYNTYPYTSEQVVAILFPENGLLPGVAHMRCKSDYLYQQYGIAGKMYLYYKNESTGELEQINDANFDFEFDGTDKWCKFDVKHNSTYVISPKEMGTNNSNSGANNSNSNLNGLAVGSDGLWHLYNNGGIMSDYSDLYCDAIYGWWLVRGGTVDFTYTGWYDSPTCGRWMIRGGAVDFSTSNVTPDIGQSGYSDGLHQASDGQWYLYQNGQVDFNYSDLYCDPILGWWKVTSGQVDFGYTGLYCSPTCGWWLIGGGAVAFDYTDLWGDPIYGWWKVTGGTVDFDYTGLYCSPTCGWWLVGGGLVAFDYTDLWGDPIYGWWKVTGGTVDFGYTDLYESPTCGWWLVNGGMVDFWYIGQYDSPQYGNWNVNGGAVVF